MTKNKQNILLNLITASALSIGIALQANAADTQKEYDNEKEHIFKTPEQTIRLKRRQATPQKNTPPQKRQKTDAITITPFSDELLEATSNTLEEMSDPVYCFQQNYYSEDSNKSLLSLQTLKYAFNNDYAWPEIVFSNLILSFENLQSPILKPFISIIIDQPLNRFIKILEKLESAHSFKAISVAQNILDQRFVISGIANCSKKIELEKLICETPLELPRHFLMKNFERNEEWSTQLLKDLLLKNHTFQNNNINQLFQYFIYSKDMQKSKNLHEILKEILLTNPDYLQTFVDHTLIPTDSQNHLFFARTISALMYSENTYSIVKNILNNYILNKKNHDLINHIIVINVNMEIPLFMNDIVNISQSDFCNKEAIACHAIYINLFKRENTWGKTIFNQFQKSEDEIHHRIIAKILALNNEDDPLLWINEQLSQMQNSTEKSHVSILKYLNEFKKVITKSTNTISNATPVTAIVLENTPQEIPAPHTPWVNHNQPQPTYYPPRPTYIPSPPLSFPGQQTYYAYPTTTNYPIIPKPHPDNR